MAINSITQILKINKDSFSVPFLTIRCFTVFCEQAILFFIPIYIYSLTNRTSFSGISFVIEWLPTLMLIPYAGILLDKFPTKVSYFLIDFLRAIIISLLSIFIIFKFNWILLAFCSSILAILSALSFVCQEKVLATKYIGSKFVSFQMILQIFEQLGTIFGPLVGVFFIKKSEIFYFLFGCSAFFLITSIIIPLLLKFSHFHEPQLKINNLKPNVIKQLYSSISYIVKNKPLLFVIFITLCVNFTYGYVNVITPFRVITELGKSNSDILILTSYAAIASIVILIISFIFVNMNKMYLGIASFISIMIGAFIICTSTSYHFYIIGYCMIFSLLPMFSVFIRYFRNLFTDKELFSQVVSAIVVINRLSFPIVGSCIALTSLLFNPKYFLIGCLVIFALFGFFAFRILKFYHEIKVDLEVKTIQTKNLLKGNT